MKIIIVLALSVTERIQQGNACKAFTKVPAHDKYAINYTFIHLLINKKGKCFKT